ncbi:Polycomb group protein EMBRYONIC FLOWER 2, partial [Morella rubra]
TGGDMCRQDSRVRLSAEEEIAAEESLSIYCKPVELYNILQRRAIRTPYFLQRCLRYKIEAKHKKRYTIFLSKFHFLLVLDSFLRRSNLEVQLSSRLGIQMRISLSGTVNESLQTQSLFPLCLFLARLVSDVTVSEANIILPEINKLALEAKSDSLAILLVSWVGAQNPLLGIDLSKGSLDTTSFPSLVGEYCLWGTIPFKSLFMSWAKSPNFSLGQRAEIMSTVNMQSCFLKSSGLNEDKCISIQLPYNPETVGTLHQVCVTISAEEIGAMERSPYNSYICSDVPSSSLSHIIRLRAGNVIFNYRYYNNKLQRTEVTEDFSCPFCLVKCASFKITEEYQAVNVSVKTDTWRSEVVADGVDPKQQTFFFCSKPLRRRRRKNLVQNAKHVHPLTLESEMPSGVCELLDKADDAHSSKGDNAYFLGANDLQNATVAAEECVNFEFNIAGVSSAAQQLHADPDCVQSIAGNNLAPPTMLQFAKTRKLSIERSDPRNCALLRKRQFFHSHRAQLLGGWLGELQEGGLQHPFKWSEWEVEVKVGLTVSDPGGNSCVSKMVFQKETSRWRNLEFC